MTNLILVFVVSILILKTRFSYTSTISYKNSWKKDVGKKLTYYIYFNFSGFLITYTRIYSYIHYIIMNRFSIDIHWNSIRYYITTTMYYIVPLELCKQNGVFYNPSPLLLNNNPLFRMCSAYWSVFPLFKL